MPLKSIHPWAVWHLDGLWLWRHLSLRLFADTKETHLKPKKINLSFLAYGIWKSVGTCHYDFLLSVFWRFGGSSCPYIKILFISFLNSWVSGDTSTFWMLICLEFCGGYGKIITQVEAMFPVPFTPWVEHLGIKVTVWSWLQVPYPSDTYQSPCISLMTSI